jgi:acyl phosphate:glycerol-3-phosphate acyltransferase
MDTWLKFALLAVAAYLLGSVPLSFLAARRRGVDLRRQGTQQVGGGNLWRTTSRKLGVLVGFYDLVKAAIMIEIAYQAGLNPSYQMLVGMAAVIGHNWPVFLRFHGGRGIATTMGILIFLPIINYNEITTWPMVAYFAVGFSTLAVARRTPVPVLLGLIMVPIASAIAGEKTSLTLCYLALLVIVIIKRLTAQKITEMRPSSLWVLFFYRFLFDRDIRDRNTWVQRKQDTTKVNN